MYLVNDLAGITTIEKDLNERHVVLLLFVKPTDEEAKSIIPKFNYFHHLADKYCSVYAAGFGENPHMEQYDDRVSVPGVDGESWWYSDLCFLGIVNELEQRLSSWVDTGESQLLIFQTNPDGREILNFQNYVSLDLAHGLRHNYFESIPRLLTSLIKASKKEVTAVKAYKSTMKRVRIRSVVEKGLAASKIVPTAVRELLQDEYFYRTSIKKEL